jgi:hypothetical protein
MPVNATAEVIIDSLSKTASVPVPFRHWRPDRMLDQTTAMALADLPVSIPEELDLDSGRREANNATRLFFDEVQQTAIPVVKDMAEALQDPTTVRAWEELCGTSLDGTFLRIEYCRDGDGFWLEPHTDIGAKRITILIYLSTDPDAAEWGTDLFDSDGRFLQSMPGQFNSALIFVPSPVTWHGFRKRPINGLRRTVIVNYVAPEWRSRHELCFPDKPVSSLIKTTVGGSGKRTQPFLRAANSALPGRPIDE